ncbi:zinc metalloprotease HtpX [Aminobacter sp. AP02]|uniref:zinc metalloprotease HtpX n=1 Tax=Aminobacter sp. AP02 TaxID=2135737 RepID=UPI000D6BF513|nr:zinc metalloprotease HtpX [Aminobacter sp. AP02]PWK64302.1 heat shock protein HtpX [Aminobacter sp. AP02]
MSEPHSINLLEHRRNHAVNALQTWLLGAGSLLLLGVTAWAFAGSTGILYAIVFGALSMWAVRRISPQMVLSMYKARQVTPADFPAGFRIVEELARRAELPATPKLYVIPSKMMNAFAVGRRNDAAIAVTDALARTLTPRELAGVLAHEISHIAHEDVKVMAFADMVSRFTSFMSTVGLVSLFFNLFGFAGGFRTQVPWLAVVVLLAAPTVGGLLQMALSRTREFEADLGAAALTGDPDGLASALTKLERAQGRLWENILLPSGRIPDPSVLRPHPLTATRIARLRALRTAEIPDELVAGSTAGRRHVPRPSIIPKIRAHPGTYLPRGARGFINAANTDFADDTRPASDAPLNPPASAPRIRVTRGGVWW